MIPVGQIIGLALRVVANRDKIASVWDQIVPLVQNIRGNDPIFDDLFHRLAPHPSDPQPPYSVEWLQQSLNTLGANLKVDGDYGDATKAAVRAFQQAHGLTVDGWAGVNTQAAILEALDQHKRI
jgi:murein L,D-transpeptidase YcbB/YkuD